MGKRALSGTVLAAALGLLAAGCARGPAPAAGGTSPTPVNKVAVELGDFYVKPSPERAGAGEVTFTVTNKGKVEHEFIVVKTDLAPDKLPVNAAESKVDEKAAGIEIIGEIETDELGPGKTASKAFNLSPGKYVLICNVSGHYAAGMHAAFTVGG